MKENLSLFLDVAKSDIQEAKSIFFGKNFKDYYLQDEEEYLQIYDQLKKGNDEDQILEEFLICTKTKRPVTFKIKETCTITKEEPFTVLQLEQEEWGYEVLELDATLGIKLSVERISTKEFRDEKYQLGIDGAQLKSDGIVTITSSTCRYEVQVKLVESEEEKNSLKNQLQELYLGFRCGSLSLDEYCDGTYEKIMDEGSTMAELIRFQLALLRGRSEEALNRMELLQELHPWEEGGFTESYYYYLKALYEKNPVSIEHALQIITENEKRDHDHPEYYLWLRFYLEKEMIFSHKKQMEALIRLENLGIHSPILRFEAVGVWNRNPVLLKNIDRFTLVHMKFGWEHQILSKEVCSQFVKVVRRMDSFSKEVWDLLKKIYEKYPEEEYLQDICNIIVHMGQWKWEYHKYLKEAVQRSLKIAGLYEAYMYTWNPETESTIDPSVLHYFSYSNSLSQDVQAILYANICEHEEEYGELGKNHMPKIESFVLHAMEQERTGVAYEYLYQKYLPQMLESRKGRMVMPNILYKRKVTFQNPEIKKVSVWYEEFREPEFYMASDGVVYVDYYSEDALLVFWNAEGNPYIGSIDMEVEEEPWNVDAYERILQEKGESNQKVIRRSVIAFTKKKQLKEWEIDQVEFLLSQTMISDKSKEVILELLLEYFDAEQENESLKQYLAQVQWDYVQEKNQAVIMEYFIQQGLYEDALKGIEKFGFEEIAPKCLRDIVLYMLGHQTEHNYMFMTAMCKELFAHGIDEKEIICHLQKYTNTDLKEGIELWKRGRKQGVYDSVFTERMLAQMVEDGEMPQDGVEIFLAYADQKHAVTTLHHEMLQLIAKAYFAKKIVITDALFEYMAMFLGNVGWDSREYPLAWLYAASKKEVLTEDESDLIQYMIEDYVEQEIEMDFFLDFDGKAELPKKLYALSYVVYRAEKEQQVTMHCKTDGEVICEKVMKEVLDGIYVSSFYGFSGETYEVSVTIEEAGDETIEGVEVIGAKKTGKNKKYDSLNAMLSEVEEEKQKEAIEVYEKVEFLINAAIEPWMEA